MELDLQSLFGLLWTAVLTPIFLRIWAYLQGRYWSAKIDDISLLLCLGYQQNFFGQMIRFGLRLVALVSIA